MLHNVNILKNSNVFEFSTSLAYSLKEIKLAKDAIIVPSPPMFTPKRSSSMFVQNGYNKSVAGTLLIIWLVIKLTKNSLWQVIFSKNSLINGMLAMFPEKTKNPQKVKSKR